MNRRRLVVFACGLVFLSAGLTAWRARQGTWSVVERGSLSLTVDVEGALRAEHSRPFGPPTVPGIWQFKITYLAPEGATVAAGTPLIRFDDSELRRQLQEVEARYETSATELRKKTTETEVRRRDDALRLAEAEAALEKARLKLRGPPGVVAANERAKLELDLELAEKKVRHLEERRRALDEADRAELTLLRESRDRAARRVEELESAIARLTVVAPSEGTVIFASPRSGEKKRVGDSVWYHEKVLEFPNLNALVADAVVREADIGRVETGQRVELRLDAKSDRAFQGVVLKVGRSVRPRNRRSPLGVVPVLIGLDDVDPMVMRPEMRFHGTIEVERVDDALLAPLPAIRETDGEPVVWRRDLLGVTPVPVVLGRRDGDRVEILQGVAEGDRLLLPAGG